MGRARSFFAIATALVFCGFGDSANADTLGEAHLRMGDYAGAADSFEDAAMHAPASARAAEGLADAVRLRIGLGQRDVAAKDATMYLRTYGAKDRATTASVVIEVAQAYVDHEEWTHALDVLAAPPNLFANAPRDLQIVTHVLRGRVLLHEKTREIAKPEFSAAQNDYRNGADLEAAITSEWPAETDAQHLRRLGRALNAVGQADLFLAESEKIGMRHFYGPPTYKGARTSAAFSQFLESIVAGWMTVRVASMEQIEARYAAILALKPFPPPSAIVAASSAVASFWEDYANDVDRLLPRTGWPREARVSGPPRSALAAVRALHDSITEKRVLPAMRKCMQLAVMLEWSDEHSRKCEAWLEKNDADHFHARSDLTPGLREESPSPVTLPLPAPKPNPNP